MSFGDKLKKFFGVSKNLSDDFYDDLCDLLVEGDFGAAEAVRLVDDLKIAAKKQKIDDAASLTELFAGLLEEELQKPFAAGGNTNLAELPAGAAVILLLGVNGVGKTTTAAKLASYYRDKGRKPILAAADTFRAAAIDQLKIHGERLGVRVVAHQHGGDPAAVVFDAASAALAGGGDLIITDTAGRMHTKSALVEELKKIDRVLENKLSGSAGGAGSTGAVCRRWLVLDATTGRNAVAQAEIFNDAVKLDGIILTKYDSSAKGGAVFSLASSLKLPAVFVCYGESYGDIKPFDPRAFAREFAGLA
jgi:fused signal recognition particle receptor